MHLLSNVRLDLRFDQLIFSVRVSLLRAEGLVTLHQSQQC